MPNRMIGTPTNVWQIAKCMYELIRHGRTFNTDIYFYCRIPSLDMSIETFGRKIVRQEFDDYSDPLRVYLLRCLARDPTQRPTPRELLHQCQESLRLLEPDISRLSGIPPNNVDNWLKADAALGGAWFSSDGYSDATTIPEGRAHVIPLGFSNE